MNDVSVTIAEAPLRAVERPRAASPFSNALAFGWRAILKFKHVPEQLFDLVMTPIMFTLLFTFVFGGALAGSASDRLQPHRSLMRLLLERRTVSRLGRK